MPLTRRETCMPWARSAPRVTLVCRTDLTARIPRPRGYWALSRFAGRIGELGKYSPWVFKTVLQAGRRVLLGS